MAAGFEMRLNTAYQDSKWLEGRGLQSALVVSVPEMLAACDRAIMPGLSALRSNVAGIPRRSGRLRSSPGTKSKIYGTTATALVGFRSGAAPHAYYIEYGAKRRLRGSTAALRPLRRAFETSQGAMAQIMAREMRMLAEKAAAAVR
jgi:hypothetical protein